LHTDFESKKGHLALRKGSAVFKFCAHCGEMLRSDSKLLGEHCDNNHKDSERTWLDYKDWPKDCKFKNFEAFLGDPSTRFDVLPGREKKIGGRPRKHPNAAKQSKELKRVQ